MSISVYIIDTSYLDEVFNVPGFSNHHSATEVKDRFQKAIESKSRFYVPWPCIFELADHIAHIPNGRKRAKLAKELSHTILSSIQKSVPWILVPPRDEDVLIELFNSYTREYVLQGIGLTDTTVVNEAKRLKKNYKGLGFDVHIWTTDIKLKALEPDSEDHPFIG